MLTTLEALEKNPPTGITYSLLENLQILTETRLGLIKEIWMTGARRLHDWPYALKGVSF